MTAPAPAPKCAKCEESEGAEVHRAYHYENGRVEFLAGCHLFAPAPSGAVTDKNSKREDVTAESLPPWTLCAQCGFDVETDEDGCCVGCGCDALQVHGGPDPRLAAPRLPAEVQKLAEFGAAILDAYTDDWRLYIDDGDVYDTAMACGVIVQRAEKHPPETECEACAEFDAPCCEVPPNISRAVTALLKPGLSREGEKK